MKKREKAPKPVFVDDGRTIADMDYEHITGYKSKEERKKHTEIRSLGLSRKERWAIYRAAFARYPRGFCALPAHVFLLYRCACRAAVGILLCDARLTGQKDCGGF